MCYSLFFSFLRSTFLSHFFPLLSSSSPLLLDQVCSKLQVLKSSTFVTMNTYINGPSLPLHMGSEMAHFRHETALWVKTSWETQALQLARSTFRTENTQKLLIYLFLAGDFPASSWTDPRRADNVGVEESAWITLQRKEHDRNVWDTCDIQHVRTAVIKVQLIVMLPFTHTHDS